MRSEWFTSIDYYYFHFSAWLSDQASPAVARLSRLISAVTNLTTETAENLQVIILFSSYYEYMN
jgi:hypothetical protein